MAVHFALLRGINVGGKNSLPMKALAETCTALGWKDVRTYIQSGNVVFTAPRSPSLGPQLSKAIAEHFSLQVPVVIRTADALERAIAEQPFTKAPPKELHLALLATTPTPAQVATLDPDRSPPDEFRVVGAHVYLRFPNGAGKSRLTNAWLDSRLRTVSTVRNWNTMLALLAMAG